MHLLQISPTLPYTSSYGGYGGYSSMHGGGYGLNGNRYGMGGMSGMGMGMGMGMGGLEQQFSWLHSIHQFTSSLGYLTEVGLLGIKAVTVSFSPLRFYDDVAILSGCPALE